jgi:NhaP-type Na+/H+ or K+/H+ antiporter
VQAEGLRTLAELALAMVLFTDAANADLGVLKHSFHIPQRLLLIGLPLTILLGFGAAVIGQSVHYFSWQVMLYALLSLTFVRMVPLFLTLAGMNLGTDEKLFMGWFGPRGLASIVFAVIVLDKHLPGGGTISMTVVCTIVLSVILHGLSAHPLVAALGASLRRFQGEEAVK